ncbi:hypothetical protein DCAR_0312937 [Daucus carota subsp. sativus]|uniref:Uncharacterized protein n=1 Tax=Daucus carota subsp. sativus TaxID=79200 RepID=A0A166BP19_DAUCS|nr:hypothetical protein DCAR_0312937 [Daucus carota subsp. sativus]
MNSLYSSHDFVHVKFVAEDYILSHLSTILFAACAE